MVEKRRGKRQRKRRHSEISFNTLFLSLLGCCIASLSVSTILYTGTYDPEASSIFSRQQLQQNDRPLAGLSCQRFGGPLDPSEMVYWKNIPSDGQFVSPLKKANKRMYLTFEPDRGGFNNVRMSMETIITMAHAMNRILVLPPDQEMYLLDGARGFGFQDFFPMNQVALEQSGLDMISTEEFLRTEGLAGHLRDEQTGRVSFPPHNRTDWNGRTDKILELLQPWLRTVAVMPKWNPDQCLAVFPDPASTGEPFDSIVSNVQSNGGFPEITTYFDKPTAVDAPAIDRLGENRAGREQLCMYDHTLQAAPVVHFHGKPKLGGRLLSHFYSFLFFEDWKQDLWTKRFVRDHLRYKDEIQCAAARIVEAIRKTHPVYDAFHIRRGEFQYKKTRLSALEIYDISKDIIPEGQAVYIATDEQDKAFFADLASHYNVLYLDDFSHLISGIDKNFYGMIDQLVASRSRVFFGCWFSTFTGYINRLRGYHADLRRLKGYKLGKIESYYYAPAIKKERMRGYWPLTGALYAREFPVSWRDIDQGIDELANLTSTDTG